MRDEGARGVARDGIERRSKAGHVRGIAESVAADGKTSARQPSNKSLDCFLYFILSGICRIVVHDAVCRVQGHPI